MAEGSYEDEAQHRFKGTLDERFGNTARSLQFLMEQQIKIQEALGRLTVENTYLLTQIASLREANESFNKKLYHDNGAESFQTRLNTLDANVNAIKKEMENLDTAKIQKSNNRMAWQVAIVGGVIGVLGSWGAAWISAQLSNQSPNKGSLNQPALIAGCPKTRDYIHPDYKST